MGVGDSRPRYAVNSLLTHQGVQNWFVNHWQILTYLKESFHMSQLFAIPQPHLYLTKRKFPGVDLLIYSRYSTKMPINFYSYFKLAFNFSLSNFVLCF